jgi:predicted Zn-dependent peptidase
MSKGIIDDDELNRAKEDIISIIKSVEDKPLRLISDLASQTIFDLDDTEKRKKEILNVTIEDVKSISKKIKIDTIYLLHGGDAVERDNN